MLWQSLLYTCEPSVLSNCRPYVSPIDQQRAALLATGLMERQPSEVEDLWKWRGGVQLRIAPVCSFLSMTTDWACLCACGACLGGPLRFDVDFTEVHSYMTRGEAILQSPEFSVSRKDSGFQELHDKVQVRAKRRHLRWGNFAFRAVGPSWPTFEIQQSACSLLGCNK